MTDINARLMKMAGMEKVSAKTTLVVSIFNSQLQGEFPPNSIYSANISDRKQYAPFYINKFQKELIIIATCLFYPHPKK